MSRSPGGGSRLGALSLGPVTFCDLSAPALREDGGAESELRATAGAGPVGFSSSLAFTGERCPFCGDRRDPSVLLSTGPQAGLLHVVASIL